MEQVAEQQITEARQSPRRQGASMSRKTQTRGYCQCCGREWAVLTGGYMSKHGYEVAGEKGWGYFNGVCSGQSFLPLNESREQTDLLIEQVRDDVRRQRKAISDWRSGAFDPPKMARRFTKRRDEEWERPWEEATDKEKEYTVSRLIDEAQHRADSGERWCDFMGKLADSVCCIVPLREVKLAGPPPAILIGDVRKSQGGLVLVCQRVDGPRVYWRGKEDSKRRGWMSTRSWRALPMQSGVQQ